MPAPPWYPPPNDNDVDYWVPLDGGQMIDAAKIEVFRIVEYEDNRPPTYELMPHLEAIDVVWPGGAKARTARIAYIFQDDPNTPGLPAWIEDALSLNSITAGVVRVGDRLAIRATRADGTTRWLFDGFPNTFEALVSEDGEGVILTCLGLEKCLWDTPIGSQIIRHGDRPDDPLVDGKANHVGTNVAAVFNADGKANCTPDGVPHSYDYNPREGEGTERLHPLFLDPRLPNKPTLWTLPRSVAYLLYTGNYEVRILNPDRQELDDVLVARVPKDGVEFDPYDEETYDTKDIITPSVPITGRPVLSVIEGLIGDKGFSVDVRLETPFEGSDPVHKIEVYDQQYTPVSDIYLQAQGSIPNVQRTNIGDCRLSRDLSEGVKRWFVRGRLARYEVSVILECGFPTDTVDVSDLTITNFDSTNINFNGYRNFYRLYVFDECGEGHYAPGSPTKLNDVSSLDAVFGEPVEGIPMYAKKRRPALGDLISKGPTLGDLFPREQDVRTRRHELAYSTDYAGACPGLWDGTGTWQEIKGGYDLLHDRLGIWINVENPENWLVGMKKVLKGVTSQAIGLPPNPRFFLRLTCVIEGDRVVGSFPEAREDSILFSKTIRYLDASDRYGLDILAAKSKYNPGETEVVVRDDRDAALAEALSLRNATDAGVLEGTITIPWITVFYDIGHRIRKIRGRELGLRTDGGTSELNPILPSVRSIHFHLIGDQQTTLHLSDSQKLRKTIRSRIRTNFRSPGFRRS